MIIIIVQKNSNEIYLRNRKQGDKILLDNISEHSGSDDSTKKYYRNPRLSNKRNHSISKVTCSFRLMVRARGRRAYKWLVIRVTWTWCASCWTTRRPWT